VICACPARRRDHGRRGSRSRVGERRSRSDAEGALYLECGRGTQAQPRGTRGDPGAANANLGLNLDLHRDSGISGSVLVAAPGDPETLALAAVGAGVALALSACGANSAAPPANSGTSAGSAPAASGGTKVGVILPETATSARWEGFDKPMLEAALKAEGLLK